MNILLAKKFERLQTKFDINQTEIFFGMYTSCVADFKFLKGDELQITNIAENLKEECESMGLKNFLKSYEMPKHYKIGKTNTAVFEFGVFYGKKIQPHRQVNIKLHRQANIDDATSNFLPRLKAFYGKFMENRPYREITENIFKIIHSDCDVRAEVICIFCQSAEEVPDALIKWHSVQYDKFGYWNFSNIRKHIKAEHLTKSALSETNVEILSESVSNADNSEMAISEVASIVVDQKTFSSDYDALPIMFDDGLC